MYDISYLLLHNLPIPALLYFALSSYRDRWLWEEKKKYTMQKASSGITNSTIHWSIHPSIYTASQPATSQFLLRDQLCLRKNTFLSGCGDPFLTPRDLSESQYLMRTLQCHNSTTPSGSLCFIPNGVHSEGITHKHAHVNLGPNPQWPPQ